VNLSKSTRAYIALVLAIAGFSVGASVFKLAQISGVPTSAIIAWRLLISSLVLMPFVLTRYRNSIQNLPPKDIGFVFLTGLVMSVHLVLAVDSLRYTSVLFNQVIINTGPIWVALMEVFILRVILPRRVWIGLGIAMIGMVLIFLVGLSTASSVTAPDIPVGNLMALVASIIGSMYIVMGRSIRQKVSIMPYLWLLYTGGAIIAVIYNTLTHTPLLGYSTQSYFYIFLATLFPTLIGHSFFNYALGYFSATVVTLSGQVVTFTAPFVAFLIFGDFPSFATILASSVLIFGVVIAVLGQRKPKENIVKELNQKTA
jgi:drug/metabolite transporter (DMT)-like permease